MVHWQKHVLRAFGFLRFPNHLCRVAVDFAGFPTNRMPWLGRVFKQVCVPVPSSRIVFRLPCSFLFRPETTFSSELQGSPVPHPTYQLSSGLLQQASYVQLFQSSRFRDSDSPANLLSWSDGFPAQIFSRAPADHTKDTNPSPSLLCML